MGLLFIFLILENIFERFVPVLSYTDEVIATICLILLVIKLPRAKVNIIYLKIALWFFGVLLIGFFGSLAYSIQTNPTAVTKDVMAISKFFIVYIYAALFLQEKNAIKIAKHISIFSKIYIPILLFFGILNQFFNIGMDTGYRGSIKTFAFLYSHSTFMVASVVVLCSFLIAQGIRKNIFLLSGAFVILLLSMRSKAFIYMIGVVIIFILLHKNKNNGMGRLFNNKIKRDLYFSGLLLIVIGYFIVKTKIISYFSWGIFAARPALYIVSFAIMKNYFPLGSGFATFASSISGEYYSPLYFKYGISNVAGLQQSTGYEYMADTYWPYIMAQFGIFGTIMYAVALLYVFKDLLRLYRTKISSLIAAISLFVYVIAGCFVESMFTNSSIILIALTLGYYLRVATSIKQE